jgi:mannose-6-phosphate isomerase-like protein (cupin superfamily)
MTDLRGTVTRTDERPRETWDAPGWKGVSWFTLFSADLSPTSGMSAGLAEIVSGAGGSTLHRHDQPEIYFVVEGVGVLTMDGRDTVVTAGSAVFIPGGVEHQLRNESGSVLKVFYVFPTDRFSEVIYRFSS